MKYNKVNNRVAKYMLGLVLFAVMIMCFSVNHFFNLTKKEVSAEEETIQTVTDTEEAYTVTLDYNDNSGQKTTKQLVYGELFTLPGNIEREGYIFNGWKDESGLFYANEKGEPFKRWDKKHNDTLTASWAKMEFMVDVNPEDDENFQNQEVIPIIWKTECLATDEIEIPYGMEFKDALSLVEELNKQEGCKKNGYIINKLVLENGEKLVDSQELLELGDGPHKISVVYEKVEDFAISYLGVPTDGVTNPLVKGYNEPITLLRPEKLGYVFEGWYVADNKENKFLSGSPYAIGTKFDYMRMPDFFPWIEVNNDNSTRFLIELEAKYTLKRITISYVPYYGSSLAPTVINYGSKVVLPIPDERKGYDFVGWYIGSNGTGEQYTDGEGQLLKEWDREVNTTLYAKWEMETYTITYISDGAPLTGMVFNTYTVTSATITLETPSKTGYRFMGWYTNSNFTGTRVYSIPKGSSENKVFYAKWAKLYTITFDSNGGLFCKNVVGIQGETVRLPVSSRKGCTGKWDTYSFGASFIMPARDVKFTARWTPNQYDLVYKIFDSTLKQTTYTYYEKDLIRQVTTEDPIYGLWRPTASSSSYVFDGWYKNRNFTTVISKIAEGTTGTVTVYGRWKYVRNEQITVTDDGVFSQPYDSVTFKQMTGYTLSQLKAKGYKTVTFTGSLTAWQKDDGYKYVQVYDGTGSNATKISEWWVDHRDGKTKRVYQLNNDGSWTFNLDALTSETLCFRYTASGTFNDTWYNSNFSIWVSNIS